MGVQAKTYSAAAQLLKWRCPKYSVKAKRVKQILNFMFNEMPMLGHWQDMVLGGIAYQGMIYPAVDPRGMSVVARAAANFDAVKGAPEEGRFLRVLHLNSTYTDLTKGEEDVQKYFDEAHLNTHHAHATRSATAA